MRFTRRPSAPPLGRTPRPPRAAIKARSLFARSALAPALAALGLLGLAGLSGCTRVLQKDREYLSDPIMQLTPDPLGQGLESHNLPRREGSAGGGSGSGGGCGC